MASQLVWRRVGALVTSAAFAIGSTQSAAAQSAAAVPDSTPRELAIKYADGHTAYQVLRPSGGSWTPFFPRIPGVETSRNGLPLTALDVAHALDGPDVRVAISLIYGRPHQDRLKVATVTVTAERSVRVDQLTAYGVEPVTLSIIALRPAPPFVPSVSASSSALEVTVEALTTENPTYQIRVINRSAQALMAFQYEGYRGDRRLYSGRQKTARHTPLVPPGGQHVFFVPAIVAPHDPSPVTRPDRVIITSVMWDDGIVEGEAAPAASEEALSAGAARQIPRVVALLQRARQETPAILHSRIEALSIDVTPADAAAVQAALSNLKVLTVDAVRFAMANGMQQVKDAAWRTWTPSSLGTHWVTLRGTCTGSNGSAGNTQTGSPASGAERDDSTSLRCDACATRSPPALMDTSRAERRPRRDWNTQCRSALPETRIGDDDDHGS